jgi:hypothetical protein
VASCNDANENLTYDTFNHYTWDADANIATVNVSTTNTYDSFDKLVETSGGWATSTRGITRMSL